MTRWVAGAGLVLMLAGSAQAGNDVSLEGYAEWREGGALVVDGQRVKPASKMKFKGEGNAQDFARIPLGYEVKVKGSRGPDGVVLAREIKAKPNGNALFEEDLRKSFDETEQQFLRRGAVFEEDEDGRRVSLGDLWTEGPDVERVREIADDVMPPYMRDQEFRIYVVDNEEWNAMAAPNHSIYVFTGLLDDLDDDEIAIVIGHELAHATHEHSRKAFKKQIITMGLAAVGEAVVDSTVENKGKRTAAQVGTILIALALTNGYGRGQEDQADRVGLRYAYEGGYDVRKAPGLWRKFAGKYGDTPGIVNFFLGDHSTAESRAKNLEKELAWNYR